MRYVIPQVAVTLMACSFPSRPLALVAYVAIVFYSLVLTAGLFRNASSGVRRQILIASSSVAGVALGIGAFFHLR